MNSRLFAALLGLAVCSVPLATSAATVDEAAAKELVKQATETFVAFRKDAAGKAGASEIPKKFWAASIRDLKPVKVYIHMNNVVVVQKVADGKEEGLYIYEPYSSHMPMDGLHGFALTPKPNTADSYSLGTGVFSYQKITTNQPVQRPYEGCQGALNGRQGSVDVVGGGDWEWEWEWADRASTWNRSERERGSAGNGRKEPKARALRLALWIIPSTPAGGSRVCQ